MKQETIIYKDVVVIGAGLTGLTAAFHLKKRGRDIQILEQNDRTGGQIQTFREGDFVFESGPNTGAISNPEVAELFSDLSPDCELEIAKAEAEIRYIWKGNKFHKLPSGLIGGVMTPLFSFPDKFRILGEPFRKKGTNPDESVGELAARRLGKSFLDYAVDPFVSGVYAGNPMTLTTRYALPKLYHLEQDYGGFIRGSIAKAKEPKTARDRLATKKVFSAQDGLSSLTDALAKRVGNEQISLSVHDILIVPEGSGWKVTFSTPEGKQTILAQKILSTVGAYSLPGLFPFIDKTEMEHIACLRYAPVIQVSVGIRDTGSKRIDGFGALVPSREQQQILGVLFPAACFKGRSPERGTLLSFFLGGVRHRDMIEYTDGQLEEIVVHGLYDMLKLPVAVRPDMIRIFRHPRAIPQYEQNSGERLDAIRRIEARYEGLSLAGNSRDGIGMAHRILQGTELGKSL